MGCQACHNQSCWMWCDQGWTWSYSGGTRSGRYETCPSGEMEGWQRGRGSCTVAGCWTGTTWDYTAAECAVRSRADAQGSCWGVPARVHARGVMRGEVGCGSMVSLGLLPHSEAQSSGCDAQLLPSWVSWGGGGQAGNELAQAACLGCCLQASGCLACQSSIAQGCWACRYGAAALQSWWERGWGSVCGQAGGVCHDALEGCLHTPQGLGSWSSRGCPLTLCTLSRALWKLARLSAAMMQLCLLWAGCW